MAIDNTHTKYLKGQDKKVWNNYKDAYEAQKKFDNFLGSFDVPDDLGDEGEYEVPVHNSKSKR